MTTLEKFYKQSIKNNIGTDKFLFKRTKLDPQLKEFLLEFIYFTGKFIYVIHQLKQFKKIDRKFIDHLRFFEEFYVFLKKKSAKFRKYLLNIQNVEESSEKILKKKDLKKYSDIYHKETSHTIFNVLQLIKYDETIIFDECLGESYKTCIKALAILIYINNNVCKNILDDLLFEIRFSLFKIMIPCQFENLDKESLGLIGQINWLKSKFSK